MRGCIVKAKTTKLRLPKGQHAWNLILSLGRGADGKHKQKWVRFHGTRKQAEQKLTDLVGEVHHGEFVEPSKLTVGQWLDYWVESAIRPPRRARNTYLLYRTVVKTHLIPQLGHIPIQKLTHMHVERYYADLKQAPRTVALHHAILRCALNKAVKDKKIRTNVAIDATSRPRPPKQGDVVRNVWTAEEARRFLSTVKEGGNAQDAAFFALALDSGLRKGELLGLQWKDINGASLRVERQLVGTHEDERTGRTALVTSPPKSKCTRTLDLSEETVALLREHKRQQAETKLKNRLHYVDHGLVFAHGWDQKTGRPSELGAPLHSVRRRFDKYCEAAKVKRITVHGLRHTCATLLLAAGVPPHVVQRRLGHEKIAITLEIYAHVLPDQQQDAASRLATLLHG